MLKPVLVTAPSVKPIGLDEVKKNCNIDHGDDDALIEGLIDAAVSLLDGHAGELGQAMINQSWSVSMRQFCASIRLPVGPLVSVTSVQYYNSSDVLTLASASLYGAFTDGLGAYISLKANQTWPSVADREGRGDSDVGGGFRRDCRQGAGRYSPGHAAACGALVSEPGNRQRR